MIYGIKFAYVLEDSLSTAYSEVQNPSLTVNSLMTTEHSKVTADQSKKRAIDNSSPDSAVQIFGEFPETLPKGQEGLSLSFLPSSLPLKKRWRTNGLSANFLADYLTTFLPGDEDLPETIAKQNEVQSAVSYIANELLENAMKFSDLTSPQPISINLRLCSNQLIFLVTNSIDAAGARKYQSFIQEVNSSNPGEMLFCRLEQSAKEQEHQSSGLGLVTIVNDYLAKLGWRFETSPENSGAMIVTTAVQLLI